MTAPLPTAPALTDRAATLEWCRAYLDHRCIFRSPPGPALLTAFAGGRSRWQLYMPVATLDQEFMKRICVLFWDKYLPLYRKRQFQLCGVESGGVPLVSMLQASAYVSGVAVNAFEIKKAQKTYGLKNWLEGVVQPDRPVLLVDDVTGAGLTLRTNAVRLRSFGLEVQGAWAVIAGNPGFPPPRKIKIGENVTADVDTLLGPYDLAWTHEAYVQKYGKPPEFHGVMR